MKLRFRVECRPTQDSNLGCAAFARDRRVTSVLFRRRSGLCVCRRFVYNSEWSRSQVSPA